MNSYMIAGGGDLTWVLAKGRADNLLNFLKNILIWSDGFAYLVNISMRSKPVTFFCH